MIKKILTFLLLTTLFVGCAMNYENSNDEPVENAAAALEQETVKPELSVGYMPTKEVQIEKIEIKSIYMENLPMFKGVVEKGMYSTQYDDGLYRGTLKSVSLHLLQEAYRKNGLVYYNVSIGYAGTVTQYDPKETVNITITKLLVKKILPGKKEEVFNGIKNGSESLSYKCEDFAGTLKSVDAQFAGYLGRSGDYINYRIIVTYKGVVSHFIPPEYKYVTVEKVIYKNVRDGEVDELINSIKTGSEVIFVQEGMYADPVRSIDCTIIKQQWYFGFIYLTLKVKYAGRIMRR